MDRDAILDILGRKGWSRDDLARALGVDGSTVRRWLSENPETRRAPTGLSLKALVKIHEELMQEQT